MSMNSNNNTGTESQTTHDAEEDARNQDILIYVNGQIVPRADACVSVYDSGFMLGDGMWEGMRLYNGVWAFFDEHMDRLFNSCKAVSMDIGMNKQDVMDALTNTAAANNMTTDVHCRLMVTRGVKVKPFQHPSLSRTGPTVVIIMEHSRPRASLHSTGIRLATVPQVRGLCNFFIVRRGEVWTSSGDYCMNGVTRQKVIDLCRYNDIPVFEKNYSLYEAYGANEAFLTGTFGAQTPVAEINKQLQFLTEADKLKSTLRATQLCDGSRRENSGEHSWHIALYAMTLAEHASVPINVTRVIQMLLIHDLVEIDAGDVPIHAEHDIEKHQLIEQAAASRIFGLLPDDQAQSYRALWDEFEAAESNDAIFAKSIDRVQPVISNLETNGGTWPEFNVTAEQLESRVGVKVQRGAPAIWEILQSRIQAFFG